MYDALRSQRVYRDACSFVIPNLIGPPYPLPLSVQMYGEGFEKGNWPLVYAMGTLLSILAVAVLLVYYMIIGSLGRTAAQNRTGGTTSSASARRRSGARART